MNDIDDFILTDHSASCLRINLKEVGLIKYEIRETDIQGSKKSRWKIMVAVKKVKGEKSLGSHYILMLCQHKLIDNWTRR